MRRKLSLLLALLLFLAGAGMILAPVFQRFQSGVESHRVIEKFDETRNLYLSLSEGSSDAEGQQLPYAQLRKDMEAYNTELYANGQNGLTDAWSYQQSIFSLADYGVVEDAVGYLTIDAMDLALPVYLGAQESNLAKGAAVLGQTSMPIGGENTNCVIAAHRGWKGIPMFREIELLQPGDIVEFTNLWETLRYEVIKTIVITPDDIDAVKIQPGEDLLTLITCHPYTQNYQRYVVYCSRIKESDAESTDLNTEKGNFPEIPFDGIAFESSAESIKQERLTETIAAALLGVFFLAIVLLFVSVLRKRKKQNQKTSDHNS